MSLIDDVIASIDADKQAAEEVSSHIAASKRQAEEVLGQLRELGVKVETHALSAAKQTLDECETQCAALTRQFEEARIAAVAAKGGGRSA
jgi:predicted transcriptional regulator